MCVELFGSAPLIPRRLACIRDIPSGVAGGVMPVFGGASSIGAFTVVLGGDKGGSGDIGGDPTTLLVVLDAVSAIASQ